MKQDFIPAYDKEFSFVFVLVIGIIMLLFGVFIGGGFSKPDIFLGTIERYFEITKIEKPKNSNYVRIYFQDGTRVISGSKGQSYMVGDKFVFCKYNR